MNTPGGSAIIDRTFSGASVRHDFTYELTPELSRHATRQFFARIINWRVPALMIVYFGLLALVSATDTPKMLTGFFLGAMVLLIVIVIAAYFYRRHHATKMLESLKDRAATVTLDDDGFNMRTEMGTTVLAWPLIERVVRGPRVWLLYVAKQPMWVPSAPLAGAAGDFLIEKVRAAGGKVD